MWKRELGVMVSLEPIQRKAFSDRLKKHEFTIARAAWFGDYPDATTWLQKMASDSGNNDCAWSNQQYDKLLDQAKAETDVKRRADLLRQAETILLHEQPMALMFQYVDVYMWNPQRVKGLKPNQWARWRLEDVELVK